MPLLLLKDLPRYDRLLEAAKTFPELDPSATEVFLHLLRAGDEAYRVCEQHLQKNNLSQGRFSVLMQLLDKESHCSHARTPAELAQLCGVTRATITGLIDTLERDGYVTREPSPNDGRMMTVHLTPSAIAFLDKLLPGHFRRMAELMKPLTEDERRQLVALFDKIVGQAAAIAGPALPNALDLDPPPPPSCCC